MDMRLMVEVLEGMPVYLITWLVGIVIMIAIIMIGSIRAELINGL